MWTRLFNSHYFYRVARAQIRYFYNLYQPLLEDFLNLNFQLFFKNSLLKPLSPTSASSSMTSPTDMMEDSSKDCISYPSMVQEAIASLASGRADCTNLNILVSSMLSGMFFFITICLVLFTWR